MANGNNKRKAYTPHDKIAAIDHFKQNGESYAVTCRALDLPRRNLRRWLTEEDKLRAQDKQRSRKRVKWHHRRRSYGTLC